MIGLLRRAVPALLAAAVCAPSLAGCGWRTGLGDGLPEGGSVAVQFLENRTRVPDLELEVTRALTDALIDRVGRRPDHPSDATYVLRGTIVDYERRSGVRSRENELLETGVRIEVQVALVRREDGAVLSEATRALAVGFAIDDRGLAVDAPAEREQRARLLRHLGEGLVLDLFRAPAYKGVE